MKKYKSTVCVIICGILLLLCACFFNFSNQKTAKAEISAYSFYFEQYDVTYDISSNRKIKVTEKIDIHFTGYMSTGFIRDIPVNGGELVKNVNVKEVKSGEAQKVFFDVFMESDDFVSVDIGDHSKKQDQTRTYILTYDYCLTKASEGKNNLILNVVGTERDCEITKTNVRLLLPDGLQSAISYMGRNGATSQIEHAFETVDGRACITMNDVALDKKEGITVKMSFQDGVLSTYTDTKPYWGIAIGTAILVLVIILKFLLFNKRFITPVVNYEAPQKMDPLIMGKLIDNKVDSEDISSLIFYWASKGYLQINLDDKDDPTLIRTVQNLPEDCADYEKTMFYNLFAKNEMVKPSSLKNKFYKTVDKVRTSVDAKAKGLFDKRSIAVSIFFVVLCALFMGAIPFFSALGISKKFLYYMPFVVAVPTFIFYALLQGISFCTLKISKRKLIALYVGVSAAWLIVSLFYVVLIPNNIIAILPKILICLVAYGIIFFAHTIVNKTPGYIAKLNDIVGFKQFITLAEKDQLEMMLEEDPQFYYHILPYAQVLGVSDKWEDKFKALTVEPPSWACGSFTENYLEFVVLNSLIRNSLRGSFTRNMTSRPSSSGSSGHGGFGGHVGGGHGGGGFRGR